MELVSREEAHEIVSLLLLLVPNGELCSQMDIIIDDLYDELARCKPVVDAASICRAEYAEVDDSELPPIVVDILKAVRVYEAGERAPEYSQAEQECNGCTGPCGRCEEESAKDD